MANKQQIKQGERTRAKITKFIASYWRKHQMSPTLQEIAAGVGLASHNAVRAQLVQMREAGTVTWVDGCARTIRLVQPKVAKAS